jgi:hypothetical protein
LFLLATAGVGSYDRGTLVDLIKEKTAIPWQARAHEGSRSIILAGHSRGLTWPGVG